MEFYVRLSCFSKSGGLIETLVESVTCYSEESEELKEELKDEVKYLVERLEDDYPMVLVDGVEDEDGNDIEGDWNE